MIEDHNREREGNGKSERGKGQVKKRMTLAELIRCTEQEQRAADCGMADDGDCVAKENKEEQSEYEEDDGWDVVDMVVWQLAQMAGAVLRTADECAAPAARMGGAETTEAVVDTMYLF
uniref:Uncharacterized protein n=1 Tax=Odontella aurita TaxID=265563 RepID=A0A7S4JX70_9STRA